MRSSVVVLIVVAALVVVAAIVLVRLIRSRTVLGTAENQTTYRILHTTSLASPELRAGLGAGAERAARHLRDLLGTTALALTDGDGVVGWAGAGGHHTHDVNRHAAKALDGGSAEVLGPDAIECQRLDCPVRHGVVTALTTEDRVVGALVAYTAARPSAGLVRAVEEVARFVSGQLELAELDQERAKLAEAEIRALRAQISPHFIYNALGAIASSVRSDPEHARELLLEFADFTRSWPMTAERFSTLWIAAPPRTAPTPPESPR
ncbi:hypothetical protein G1H11_10615 [Phytoactinopolyspora alkaliphila]|uniref:Signal transduction histidine kinase internal region domain-containing protein n=1 Tax=Phytoactinopolyspora alkaliphila TaxID=1783498 RepID=A0A6N9YLC6_9ACTN|nr:histidine kinase [Phytoactinopolyspora alkaliphila]NED95765.1 hypothetical protein [Phytoactinopolyspora alkaliphila]